jgi:hypothetical protein
LVFKDDEEGRGSPVVSGPAVGATHNPDEEKEHQEQDPPTRRKSQGRLTRGALV